MSPRCNRAVIGVAMISAFVALAAPTKAVAFGVPTIPEVILNNLQVRTPLDDVFSGVLQRADSPLAAEMELNRKLEAGKQRLAAAFGAQKLIICNFPFLGQDQKAQCINKLNESYQARLSELSRQFESERTKLASCYVTF